MTRLAFGRLLASGVGIALLGSGVVARPSEAPVQNGVPAACIPFDTPIINRPIDSAADGCGLPGKETETTTSSQEHGRQNRAKNNFCAWQGATPALVTRFSFDRLDATLLKGAEAAHGPFLPVR